MKKFELSIFRQSRVLIAVFMFSLSLAGAIYLASVIEDVALSVIVPICGFVLLNFCACYAVIGTLEITVKDGRLSFSWIRKLLFNFSPIPDINIKDIETLIIDRGDRNPLGKQEFLRKIITHDRSILIGTAKFWKKDADAFIWYLKTYSNARVIDSWDILKERGFLKIGYTLTTFLLVAGLILMFWVLYNDGFEVIATRHWIFFFFSYTIMVTYWLMMKRKLRKQVVTKPKAH